jgi:hypothetical protein
MYFKGSVQNYPSLYEGALEVGRIIVLMAHAYLHESQQYRLSPLPKDTNHLSCLVFYVYKMSSNQRNYYCFFLTTLPEGF